MASPTVIRVKRRREGNPQEALLVLCKRPRVDTADVEEVSSVFVFRGSDTNKIEAIKKATKSLPETGRPQVNIIETLREDRNKSSAQSRYEVMNRSRDICIEDVDILDTTKTDNGKNEVNGDEINNEEDPSPYEYDVYTAPIDFDPAMIDSICRVDDMEFGWRVARSDDEDDDEESIDSNHELYYENDYPDEEEKINAGSFFKRQIMKEEEEDSSDDELEQYAGESFENDVKDYGAAYAKYKAKMLTEQNLSDTLIHSFKINDAESNGNSDMDSDGKNENDSCNHDSDDGFYYGKDDEPSDDLSDGSKNE